MLFTSNRGIIFYFHQWALWDGPEQSANRALRLEFNVLGGMVPLDSLSRHDSKLSIAFNFPHWK